jgi:hypothetical protein
MELFIVHDGGQREHYMSAELFTELGTWPGDKPITDAMAQTIAAWWLDGRNPLSMVLATSGRVDRRMNRETFTDDATYAALPQGDRFALDRLVDYIEYHIAMAPSCSRPCACDDCGYLTTGIVGEMCSHCEDAGCEYGESCNVEDAYDDDTAGCNCDVLAYPAGYRCPHAPARVADQHGQGNHTLCVTETGYCD